MTRTADVEWAVAAGADAVGLVFHPPSPRAVDIEQAAALARAVPPFVALVGLFVDADPERVRAVLDRVPLDLLQLHGDEPPAYCASFGRRWIKAVRVGPEVDLRECARTYAGGAGLLLDAYVAGLPGGTGLTFDWDRIPPDLAPRIVLAGGLAPDNVAEAIRRVRPFAVDVSGGVEATRGVKDPARISAFMQGVRDGDSATIHP